MNRHVICIIAAGLTGCSQRQNAPAPIMNYQGQTLSHGSSLRYIQVQKGETLTGIAQRNGVTVSELISQNNLKPPYRLKPGHQLCMPSLVNSKGTKSSRPSWKRDLEDKPVVSKFVSKPPKPGQVVVLPPEENDNSSDPMFQNDPKSTDIATLDNTVEPQIKSAKETSKMQGPSTKIKVVDKCDSENNLQARSDSGDQKDMIAPQEIVVQDNNRIVQEKDTVGQKKQNFGHKQFAWPVQGKILQAFGSSDLGMQNDGINIAAKEGDPIRCVQEGVVAYVGNEIHGFGNLVMVKHGDGWISAYAHCASTLVKKGDRVQKSTVIAKVGHTGNVQSPQLHFELRQKTKAVDPTQYLE